MIAGFQGMHKETGRITTLGRGGSDTSAVAIAAAIGAERCDIYTDVDGVYTTDPRVVPKAHRMDKIAYEEMLELASLGAKVMQVRSVELGMVHNVRIFVRSSFEKPEDIDPRKPPSGTLICDEREIMEQQTVTGIAFSKDEAQISIRRVQDKPGVAAAIFGPLADASINVDMIVQNVSADGATTDLTFTVPSADYERARVTIEKAKGAIGFERLDGATDVAKVSVIGIGMRSHAGVAAQAFKALSEQKINILAITTSEIKFSVLIDAAHTELAVRTLHTLYGLDKYATKLNKIGRKSPMRVVALEEHFTVPALVKRIDPGAISRRGFRPRKAPPGRPNPMELLPEIGERRLKSMDEAGITVQVLSNTGPGPDLVPGADGVAMAREMNDHLAAADRRAIPTASPASRCCRCKAPTPAPPSWCAPSRSSSSWAR